MLKRVVKEYRKSIYTKHDRSIRGCGVTVTRGEAHPTRALLGSSTALCSRHGRKTPGHKKLIVSTLNFPKVKYRFAGKAYRVLFEKRRIEFRFHRSHKFYFYYNQDRTRIDFRKNKWVWFKFTINKNGFTNLNRALANIRKKNIFTK